MDEVLAAALALEEPGRFLRTGDHAIEGLYEVRDAEQEEAPAETSTEMPAPPGVN